MLILASNTDLLRITTGSAGKIDVHASWMDNVAGSIAPGRTNTANIITAGTTTVVGSPAVGAQRSLKTLHVFNRGTTNNAITVIHTDGSTSVELHKVTLPPNTSLQYVDEIGFVNTISGIAGMKNLIAQRVITTAVDHIDFVNEINPIYNEYELHVLGLQVNAVGAAIAVRVSKNAGVTWEADPAAQYGYAWQAQAASNVNVNFGGYDIAWYLSNPLEATVVDAFANASFILHAAYLAKSGVRKQMWGEGMMQDPIEGPTRIVAGCTFSDDTHSNPPINGLRFLLMPEGGPAKMSVGTFNLYGTRVS